MRCFVSIDFKKKLLEEIKTWIPDLDGWKNTELHQMHCTLFFLGECSRIEMDQIHKKLAAIEFVPFQVTIRGLNVFPHSSSPRILWAGVEPTDELLSLQRKVSGMLYEYAKSNNDKTYIPHITLWNCYKKMDSELRVIMQLVLV